MQRRTLMLIVVGIVGLAMVATAIGVYAQPGPAPGGAPGGGFGGRGGGFMGMMGGSTAIAVSGDSVYVVFMGTLFKFNADTLEEVAQVRLRPEGMPMMGPGGAGGAPPAPPGAP